MGKLLENILVPIGIALLSLLLSGYAAYSHNDKAIEHRLTTVEEGQKNDHENIQRIREDVTWLVRLMGKQ